LPAPFLSQAFKRVLARSVINAIATFCIPPEVYDFPIPKGQVLTWSDLMSPRHLWHQGPSGAFLPQGWCFATLIIRFHS
jgi:hypothetical protein